MGPLPSPVVGDDDVLAFAQRLLSLIDTTSTFSTYKLATLIALIDLAAETPESGDDEPVVVSGLEVGRRVVALYWPQTAPYGAASQSDGVLAQSPGKARDIPAKLAEWRQHHGLSAGSTIEDARAVDPDGWQALEDQFAATVVGMPLAKLQRFGDGRHTVEDRFLYEFSWRDEVKPPSVLRDGFDDAVQFQPGVAALLVRLGPLLRPLVEARWAGQVAARNPDLVDAHQLHEFLFGATRISLDRIRGPLLDLQDGACFYCGARIGSAAAVDHFVPWARHPDNTLDNLVAVDAACNSSKSSSLAGAAHLEHWTARFRSPVLDDTAHATPWPRRPDRTLAAVRASYLWLPPNAWLWQSREQLEPVDPDRLRRILAQAT